MSKRKALTKQQRIKLWESSDKKCQYCGENITYSQMQLDHINAIQEGGKNELENYRCACRMCNYGKYTFSIDEFKQYIKRIPEKLIKRHFDFRIAMKYGLIEIKDKEIVFEFENKEGGIDDNY